MLLVLMHRLLPETCRLGGSTHFRAGCLLCATQTPGAQGLGGFSTAVVVKFGTENCRSLRNTTIHLTKLTTIASMNITHVGDFVFMITLSCVMTIVATASIQAHDEWSGRRSKQSFYTCKLLTISMVAINMKGQCLGIWGWVLDGLWMFLTP